MRNQVKKKLKLAEIEPVLRNTKSPSWQELDDIIASAEEMNGLRESEVARLLKLKDGKKINRLLEVAGKIKEKIYGKRLVVFAPLYLDNYCSNDCLYCGYRVSNHKLTRKELTAAELEREVQQLLRTGQKRLLVLTGERNSTDIGALLRKIKDIYKIKGDNPGEEVKRINLEIAPLSESDFEKITEADIGTYTCFQETYHPETYDKMHPSGKKKDYSWRLEVMDRALKAGIDDYGIGVLFGLYDFRYEILAMLRHARYLEERYGIGPHTISVPRFKPAAGADIDKAPYPVNENQFKLLIAVIRLAVPYTGLILSTRESTQLRNDLFEYGISQISAGSCTSPGGYSESDKESGQFKLYDNRSLAEIIKEAVAADYLPSFCTSCYRSGRTGRDFMELAKPGNIKTYCQANALLTFAEYLYNYADDELEEKGLTLVKNNIEKFKLEEPELGQKLEDKLVGLERDKYDFYF
ncbi:MAG: [FeFe] hydrogenase H-cluster radical SAM maturase HydG [Bacillota bacterium]